MNAQDQLAQMQLWLDTHPTWPNDPNAGPRFLEDPETLARSRGGLSRSARTEQRRPKPYTVDELGYTSTGAWSPDAGEAA